MQADLVVDLLLIDEANPRSVAYQLARLGEHINELPESKGSTRRPPEARLALSMLTAVQLAEVEALVSVDANGRRCQLEALLAKLTADLKLLGEKLTSSYFAHAQTSRQMVGR